MSGRISNPARCLALRSGHSEVVAGSIATKSVVRGWGAGIRIGLFFVCTALAPCCIAQGATPDWCRALPHPEYKNLQRIPVSDAWFEVYKPAPGVFAIYEPHQSEETIGYLITGTKRALLFDTGMGISDIKEVTAELSKLPVIVLNSHTHDDHVGGNWEFKTVYGMDTDFTRANAKGSREDAQAEIAPGEICGALPRDFDAKSYRTRPWRITKYIHDGEKIELGGRSIEVIATPRAYSGRNLIVRSRERAVVHRRHLLSRAHLAVSSGDGFECLCGVHPATGSPRAPSEGSAGTHNVPVASAAVLPRLVSGFDAVRAGKVVGRPAPGGKVLYTVNGITFLMRAP